VIVLGTGQRTLRKSKGVDFVLKPIQGVKCMKCEKAFHLTKDKNSFMAYHIKQLQVNIFVP